jgi:TRAP-type C4-dicarboxylate transport system substrate-binding protein
VRIVLTGLEFFSVPGLLQSEQHAVKTVADPEFAKAFLAVGANKGLVGAGLLIGGPAAFATRTCAYPCRPQCSASL